MKILKMRGDMSVATYSDVKDRRWSKDPGVMQVIWFWNSDLNPKKE